jgi:hypothetical protein
VRLTIHLHQEPRGKKEMREFGQGSQCDVGPVLYTFTHGVLGGGLKVKAGGG